MEIDRSKILTLKDLNADREKVKEHFDEYGLFANGFDDFAEYEKCAEILDAFYEKKGSKEYKADKRARMIFRHLFEMAGVECGSLKCAGIFGYVRTEDDRFYEYFYPCKEEDPKEKMKLLEAIFGKKDKGEDNE